MKTETNTPNNKNNEIKEDQETNKKLIDKYALNRFPNCYRTHIDDGEHLFCTPKNADEYFTNDEKGIKQYSRHLDILEQEKLANRRTINRLSKYKR